MGFDGFRSEWHIQVSILQEKKGRRDRLQEEKWGWGCHTIRVLGFQPMKDPCSVFCLFVLTLDIFREALGSGASRVVLVVRAGDVRKAGWTPGLGRSLGGRHGHLFQCSCLENPVDRGAWRAMVWKQGWKEGAGLYHIRFTQLYWVNCYIG